MTQRESATVEGRLSWLKGAYTQMNERLGALGRGQDGLRAEIQARRGKINRLRMDMAARPCSSSACSAG